MRKWTLALVLMLGIGQVSAQEIDRKEVVRRNNPHVTTMDKLASLSVGNGRFAFTVDATGLQTFPEEYSSGVPLGTMSDWGWDSFSNLKHFKDEDVLVERDFGRGHKESIPHSLNNQVSRRRQRATFVPIHTVCIWEPSVSTWMTCRK